MPTIELAGVGRTVSAPGRSTPLSLLDGVDLRVAPGEKVAVLGRSGSGKSTLLSVLGLLAPVCSGRYLFDGEDLGRWGGRARDRLRARTFGFVLQRPCLLPHLTAAENVEVALVHQGVAPAHRRARSLRALHEVGLADRTRHRPGQLSGGEQQRVALARAVVAEPSVILADEPTGALDDETGRLVLALLHALACARGISMVVVTHDPVVVRGCDRSVAIERGRLVSR